MHAKLKWVTFQYCMSCMYTYFILDRCEDHKKKRLCLAYLRKLIYAASSKIMRLFLYKAESVFNYGFRIFVKKKFSKHSFDCCYVLHITFQKYPSNMCLINL